MSDTDPDVSAQAPDGRTSLSAAADTADDMAGSDISAALRVAGSVAGQTTLVVALLFYFGWARTQAEMGYFGVSTSVANLSVNDYVLRSLDVAVRLLVILGLLTLILLAGHRWLAGVLADRPRPAMARVAVLACVLAGVLLCIAGVLGFGNWVVYSTQYPFVPIMLAVGVTLVGYGFRIRRLAQPDLRSRGWSARTMTTMLVVLDIALIFWAVAVYASISGRQVGEQLVSSLGTEPRVVVYSEKALGLAAPGLKVEQLPESSYQYRYRYSNLRLLLYSSGRYFLLPDGWKQGRDPVFLLNEGNGSRIEFYSGS
jgi:hypothetical protein